MIMMSFVPPDDILEKYADLLVNFALGGGRGMSPGQTVYLQSPVSALPLYTHLRKAIIKAGGHIINGLYDDTSGMSRYFYENASETQLTKLLDKYYKGLVDQVDHRIAVIADYDVHELDGVDPKKIMLSQKTSRPVMEWFDKKEDDGKYTWTLALYGTKAMAEEAGLPIRQYWKQIIKACYLDEPDPIDQWKQITSEVKRVSDKLTKLDIRKVHITGKDADLHIKIGDNRRWLSGSGRNIPSFEVFTSPDWSGTEGWIRFNQPLYRYGSMVKGIELQFQKGKVVKASAEENENLLLEMLATDEGASRVGEFSLTDKRLSRITQFMAQTLFDENMGGKYGNTHIAVGRAYRDAYKEGTKGVAAETFKKAGFNQSSIHTDMISTTNRSVLADLAGGQRKLIYEDGQFQI